MTNLSLQTQSANFLAVIHIWQVNKQHALLMHAETHVKVLLLHIHYFGLILTKMESANKF